MARHGVFLLFIFKQMACCFSINMDSKGKDFFKEVVFDSQLFKNWSLHRWLSFRNSTSVQLLMLFCQHIIQSIAVADWCIYHPYYWGTAHTQNATLKWILVFSRYRVCIVSSLSILRYPTMLCVPLLFYFFIFLQNFIDKASKYFLPI